MLRTNLSSRPFYNERLTAFAIAVVGVIAVALIVVSVQQIVSLSSRRTKLRADIARDEAATSRADTESVKLQQAINGKTLKGLAVSTQRANTLIDERTFSWTVFFGLIEKTLPSDVRIVSVAPVIDKNGVLVLMTVIAKRPEDLSKFIAGLQGTGTFYDVLPRQEDATDDGMRRTSLEARYLPPKAEALAAAKKAASSPAPESAAASDVSAAPTAEKTTPTNSAKPPVSAPKAPAPGKTVQPVKKGGGQ